MASVTLRADKGTELTWAEVDQNFTNLSNSAFVSVKDSAFGAVGDGVTDDTSAIQAAIDAAYGGTLYVPQGRYLVSNLYIYRPITIIGDTISDIVHSSYTGSAWTGGTVFIPVAGATGYAFTIGRQNIPKVSTDLVNDENHVFGVNFEKIHVDGVDRSEDWGGLKLVGLDKSTFSKCLFTNLAREAIRFQTSVRECGFYEVVTRWCGLENIYPAINITEYGEITDAHNNLDFVGCRFIFSMGDTIWIDSHISSVVRSIRFSNLMLHGIISQYDGYLYSYTAAMKANYLVKILGGFDIMLTNVTWRAPGLDTPAIYVGSSTYGTATDWVAMTGNHFGAHYTGTTTAYALYIDNGKVACTNCFWRGQGTASWYTSANGTFIDNGNAIVDGYPGAYPAAGIERNWWYTDAKFERDIIMSETKTFYGNIFRSRNGPVFFKDDAGVNCAQIDTEDLFKIESAAWDSKHFKIGGNHIWKDDVTVWRVKGSAPAAARDGVGLHDPYAVTSVTSTGTTTIDYNGQNVLVFSPASPLTVTDFTTTYENNGTTLWLKFSNANTTLQHNSNMRFKSGADYTPVQYEMLIAKLIEGVWYFSQ